MTSCIVTYLTIFLCECLQSTKTGIDIGKAWVSLGWLIQYHLSLGTQNPALAGASLEVEEEKRLRTPIHWSLEGAGQLVLSHHDNREPSGMRKCGMLVTSMYTSPKYHSLDKTYWLNCVSSKTEG